ncbi:hypothetical protein SAMD00023353_4700850 [Rosellinia necatrix]|uniref:Uncharacterized protein n=1 Tax=Rosellinia necatrix TaxID=77044 RepID=A0A1S8A9N9_ROSNE|nr:hypothetical protein SAMD00023353_4700850 [Rosellinia necatrix]
MAESFSWLRLGTRSRAPSAPLPANEVSRKTTRDSRSSDIQRPSPSCVSSHISTSEAKPDPLSIDDESPTFLIRSQDQVWYNPSLDQMVEALQVMLMTRGVLGSIPIEYNAYILHLIEGFAKSQKKIQETEAACQEMKQSLERNLEEFQLVTEDWLERESQYRAEVKRLEVLLSKSSEDGLAAVTLARTNSVIDRRGSEGDRFLSKLKVFRKSSANGIPKGEK